MWKRSNDERPIMIGMDFFDRIREEGGYYVDKTALIDRLLERKGVYLFTRPRRFGKTLNLTMIDAYFNVRYKGNTWFDGLRISELRPDDPMKNSCTVLLLFMKDLMAGTFEAFLDGMRQKISELCKSFAELSESDRQDPADRSLFRRLKSGIASEADLRCSLSLITRMLSVEHDRKVVLLIDEYDNAVNEAGSEDMRKKVLEFMSVFLSSALKSNPSLAFAVVTGVMQIAKASIFSGLNNLYVNSVFDEGFDEYWGFTENEVRRLCADFGDESRFEEAREWYDGYRFGSADVYNPWSVLNYVDSGFKAKSYWSNTATNRFLDRLFRRADMSSMERLIDLEGSGIRERLKTSISYEEADIFEDSLYTVMAMTGYLKVVPEENDVFRLSVPNSEIRILMAARMESLVRFDPGSYQDFCNAVLKGRIDDIETILGKILRQGSYWNLRDEVSYELVIMTILYGIAGSYDVSTESEAGNGRVDIILKPKRPGIVPMIVELKKTAEEKDLEADARAGLRRIHEKRYYLGMNGTILLYGISFLGKVPFIAHDRLDTSSCSRESL